MKGENEHDRCPEQPEAYDSTTHNDTVLRTNSESKPRCPEQPEAYNFTLIM